MIDKKDPFSTNIIPRKKDAFETNIVARDIEIEEKNNFVVKLSISIFVITLILATIILCFVFIK